MLEPWNWGLTRDALAGCCATDDFAEFYRRLAAAATRLEPGTQATFDKTPRYIATLAECLARVPVPFIVTAKDPRATVYSDFRHAKAADFDPWYERYCEEKHGYMRQAYAEWQRAGSRRTRRRVFRTRLETLCLDARRTCEAMFAHVGLPFRLEYTAFAELRFNQTRGRSIAVGAPFDYTHGLTAAQRRRIEQDFAAFADWFYS